MEEDKALKLFSLKEVEKHNGDEKSVWIVVHDKVYDISKFMDEVGLRDFY